MYILYYQNAELLILLIKMVIHVHVIQDIINNFTIFDAIYYEVPVHFTAAAADFWLDKASGLEKFLFFQIIYGNLHNILAAYDLGGVVTNFRKEGEEVVRTKKLGHLKEVHW